MSLSSLAALGAIGGAEFPIKWNLNGSGVLLSKRHFSTQRRRALEPPLDGPHRRMSTSRPTWPSTRGPHQRERDGSCQCRGRSFRASEQTGRRRDGRKWLAASVVFQLAVAERRSSRSREQVNLFCLNGRHFRYHSYRSWRLQFWAASGLGRHTLTPTR